MAPAIKAVLTTLNSKYIHSSLALRYLCACTRSKSLPCEILEFNINQDLHYMASALLEREPEMIGFAAYIWNIEQTLKLCSLLKRAQPSLIVVLGGPEVSFDPERLLSESSDIDIIVKGEGEETFPELLQSMEPGLVSGICYRMPDGTIANNVDREPIEDLDSIPSPYGGNGMTAEDFKDRIAYYETSRGCPFSCQYCLSSLTPGVRFFSLGRVETDIRNLLAAGVKQVKFVDRTFNCHRERAMRIWSFLMDVSPSHPPYSTTFHFEIGADLLSRDELVLLSKAPPGLFQFEIGVQTTNAETLNAVSRRTDLGKLKESVGRLTAKGNIGIHLDLISGLPGDTLESMMDSIDSVLALKPHNLQLGFLKLLKGSGLRRRATDLGIEYAPYPPYEVVRTKEMNYQDLSLLRRMEDLIDRYYNLGRFKATLSHMMGSGYKGKPSEFLRDFSEFWYKHGLYSRGHKFEELYRILYEFAVTSCPDEGEKVADLLKFDLLEGQKPAPLPKWMNPTPICSTTPDRALIEKYAPELKGFRGRELSRRCHFEVFDTDILGSGERRPTALLFIYGAVEQGGSASRILEIPERGQDF